MPCLKCRRTLGPCGLFPAMLPNMILGLPRGIVSAMLKGRSTVKPRWLSNTKLSRNLLLKLHPADGLEDRIMLKTVF